MANDLNQCNFIGRLGADPEIRYTTSGKAVASFRIAVGSKYKDQEKTEWVSITAWEKLAEICGEYLKKGSQVFISGRMETEEYEKDGIKRYSTKIIANTMQMLGGRTEGSQAGASRTGNTNAAPQQQKSDSGGFEDFESDIPF